MLVRESQKPFFWLFFSIGFFLCIFLTINEYFSHQIFTKELHTQITYCETLSTDCGFDALKQSDLKDLNANQKRIIELTSLVQSYGSSMLKNLYIFLIFLFIGILPVLGNLYHEIRSNLRLSR